MLFMDRYGFFVQRQRNSHVAMESGHILFLQNIKYEAYLIIPTLQGKRALCHLVLPGHLLDMKSVFGFNCSRSELQHFPVNPDMIYCVCSSLNETVLLQKFNTSNNHVKK